MTPPIPITFVLPSLAGGGAERVVLTLANNLDRGSFAPRLVLLDDSGPLNDMLDSEIPVVNLQRPRLRNALPALCRELRRQRPKILMSTMGYLNQGVLALKPLLPRSVRYVVREANLPARADQSRRMFRDLGYRKLYPRADVVLCPARRVAEALTEERGVRGANLQIIYNPVAEGDIRRQGAAAQRTLGEGLRLVASGRLTRQKGFDRLIQQFSSLPGDAQLTIFGEGELGRALEAKTKEAGIADRIGFPGFTDNPWTWYAGADAFLLPSRWEGLPNAALESLACGTPVIATPESGGIGEIAELAEPGAVTIAESGPEFVRAIAGLAPRKPEEIRPSLLPGDFRLATVVAQYESLFKRLAAG